jgi:hypothetical protein
VLIVRCEPQVACLEQMYFWPRRCGCSLLHKKTFAALTVPLTAHTVTKHTLLWVDTLATCMQAKFACHVTEHFTCFTCFAKCLSYLQVESIDSLHACWAHGSCVLYQRNQSDGQQQQDPIGNSSCNHVPCCAALLLGAARQRWSTMP